ncbi:unnamed protein product [Rotaria socialis]|uniref:Delta-1-pyrroline-5-carboxylate synthase n=1 Tax=Rotaria socialis TaxID=392032 RepID=A0A817KY25_9BILA|nr:unnamed protein product [Rotaria socialis]CAF3419764.1 unnamed protein product [Rotaria socialis]CAF4208484.1 unnamed protein product [Rotaria socialis]CAF4220504.1 unnamed protein product [Rotaria socialis]
MSILSRYGYSSWSRMSTLNIVSKRTQTAVSSLLHTNGTIKPKKSSISCRTDMKDARRIIVKLGTALITRENEDGLAIGRLASTVEQVSQLQNEGRQMLLVTSGAVAFGRQVLRKEAMMTMTMRKSLSPKDILLNSRLAIQRQACAAFGQKGLMSFYERMFQQYNIGVAQVLVTKSDFYNADSRKNLQATLDELLNLNIIPILNTNDAVAPCTDTDAEVTAAKDDIVINDNDSLAARLAVLISADLLLIMSDVNGLYTGPPEAEGSRLLNTFCPKNDSQLITFGARSKVGTGGMESKVKCASWALDHDVGVVITNGQIDKAILNIIDGKKIGTFFTNIPNTSLPVDIQAIKARDGSRLLQKLTSHQRKEIINKIASNLNEYSNDILHANKHDLDEAIKGGLKSSLIGRLGLTEKKLQTLSLGLQQIAEKSGVLGKVVRRTRLADGLLLKQITAPIGVLLVIFESRPDSLPQIAALSICSGNGLLLKGGSEAKYSNEILTKLIQDALEPHASRDTIALINKREQVSDLLKLGKYIDLVIPRGSNELVRSVQKQSIHIPVLGHAEGICHVYVDKDANLDMALRIVRDSKCDYPSACNAMETLLIHKDLIRTPFFESLIDLLRSEKVKVYSGPRLSTMVPFPPPSATSLRVEYGDLQCAIEVVDDVKDAIEHINKFSSNHTDSIVTENQNTASNFLNDVDSACVFHNVSTRFSDGYRFGLGAEVGISTGRIHARGPVGIEGLLTTKWIVEGHGDVVADFTEGRKNFVHETLGLIDNFVEEKCK